jgi:hypothetical protein
MPGSGGKSGAVVAITGIPGFWSYEMVASASLGFFFDTGATFPRSFTLGQTHNIWAIFAQTRGSRRSR